MIMKLAFLTALIMSATPVLATGHRRYVGELAARTCIHALNYNTDFNYSFGQAYLDMTSNYPGLMNEPTISLREEVRFEVYTVCPDFFDAN